MMSETIDPSPASPGGDATGQKQSETPEAEGAAIVRPPAPEAGLMPGGKQTAKRITVQCPSCRRGVKISREWIGKRETCPYCSAAMTVTDAPAGEDVADPLDAARSSRLCGALAVVLAMLTWYLWHRNVPMVGLSLLASVGLAAAAVGLFYVSRLRMASMETGRFGPSAERDRANNTATAGMALGLVALLIDLVLGIVLLTQIMKNLE